MAKSGRFKLEVVSTLVENSVRRTRTSLIDWFDDRERLDATVKFMQGCPVEDIVEVKFRITEYGMMPIKTEEVAYGTHQKAD